MVGRFDRNRFKQVMLAINTKRELDRLKVEKNLNSYNDVILYLIGNHD